MPAKKEPEETTEKTMESTDSVEQVLVPLVQAKVAGRVMHFYQGDVLPGGTDKETLENLRSLGFLGKPDTK